jgi:hypothetical protein
MYFLCRALFLWSLNIHYSDHNSQLMKKRCCFRALFKAISKNCKKRLLALSFLSVCPSVSPHVRMEKLGFY